MIKTERALISLVEKRQSGIYDKNASLIRHYAGKIRTIIKLKNVLDSSILIVEIDKFLQIINPIFTKEIAWFKEMQNALKAWSNDLVITNRVLGITNDNTYDVTEFEKAIMQHFFLTEKPKYYVKISTDFKTLIELVELGVRRFRY